MHCLIEGLPDEVALQCLACVPFFSHSNMQLVCHAWRTALRSTDLFKVRLEVGASEELLCVLAFEPENTWQLYDPATDHWITLPIMPTEIRHLAHFGAASVAGKLFVIGGGSDQVDPSTGDHDQIFATNEVWSYDPIMKEWARRAPMLVPRAMFACCEFDGKIVVAGGFTNCRESISKAKIYDPEANLWQPLPDLRRTSSSACFGQVIGGRMHVLHKGLSTVQILEDGGQSWAVEYYPWLQGPMAGPVAVVRGEPYMLSDCLMKPQRTGFGMIGLGDEIYVIGGVIGPDRGTSASSNCLMLMS